MSDRKYPPLAADHPMVVDQDTCAACNEAFKAGDVVTLIPIGPGTDPDARAKARRMQPYTAVALPVHWACATGEEETDA